MATFSEYLTGLIASVQARVDVHAKNMTDPDKKFYGKKQGVGKDGRKWEITLTAKDAHWKWSDRLETLKAIAEKRLPSYLAEKPAQATANSLVKPDEQAEYAEFQKFKAWKASQK